MHIIIGQAKNFNTQCDKVFKTVRVLYLYLPMSPWPETVWRLLGWTLKDTFTIPPCQLKRRTSVSLLFDFTFHFNLSQLLFWLISFLSPLKLIPVSLHLGCGRVIENLCLYMFCIHYIYFPMPGLFDITLRIKDSTLTNGNENGLSDMSLCASKDDALSSSLSCSEPSYLWH